MAKGRQYAADFKKNLVNDRKEGVNDRKRGMNGKRASFIGAQKSPDFSAGAALIKISDFYIFFHHLNKL